MNGQMSPKCSPLLNEKPKNLLESFLRDYNKLFNIDLEKSRRILKDGTLFEKLTNEWYKNLKENNMKKALSVYNDDYYFIDIFDCFRTYSRKYLRSVLKLKEFKDVKSFIDLGCGLSYSTVALRQMFPKAKGYATNLKATKQWKFCKIMAEKYDFVLIETVNEVKHDIDLVFASEYFEHIINPINHLKDIIEKTNPKYLIIANSFNTKSIGHFQQYHYQEGDAFWSIHESDMSKMFNRFLKSNGYEKIKTDIWNDKPTIWVRHD